MNIKLFYQNNKKTILITISSVIIVTILLIIFLHKPRPVPLTPQDIIKQAVDSAIIPIQRDIIRLQNTNDSLSTVIKSRQYRDVQRDKNILNNNNDIDQINKKLNEETNNTKHYNGANIDSFIRTRNY